VPGIGPETADSILLYAGGVPIFVVDAYTRRILSRHGLIAPDASYAEMQALFMSVLPPNAPLYNEYHALLVAVGKEYCRPTPRCAGCPLRRDLERHCPSTARRFLALKRQA
jgi:endonuclease-3 related protein